MISNTEWADKTAPTPNDLLALVEDAQGALPDAFRASAKNVAIRIEDLADADVCAELGVDAPFEISGLYDGVPLTEKSVMDQPDRPDTIWLFRLPILAEWAERGDVALGHLVGHVYIHELAHHFGWSDADIAAIDPWWT